MDLCTTDCFTTCFVAEGGIGCSEADGIPDSLGLHLAGLEVGATEVACLGGFGLAQELVKVAKVSEESKNDFVEIDPGVGGSTAAEWEKKTQIGRAGA